MSSVDSRIVTMKFDNTQFESGARTSLSTLQKLKESMNFGSAGSSAARGLGAIGNIFSKFGLHNPFATATAGATELNRASTGVATSGLSVLEGGITHVSGAFLAMSTVAITALSNITTRAISAGASFAKSFTVGPILDGLHEYQTNLQSIQTIQANTDRPLTEINASLDELNHYSDRTIYNFSEMARNIGTFTAAGVDLKTATSSIKGIANMAALSGSTSQQAATAMYQLSQAISSGRVSLMDWNSVVNAGMGGKKLQNALAQTAVAMGTLNGNAVKMVGPMQKLTVQGKSFRESIMAAPGNTAWLSGDVLVNTLATLDGRFSRMALSTEKAANGTIKYTKAEVTAKIAAARHNLEVKNGVKYTDAQFKSLMKLSDSSFLAATQVKTFGQAMDVAKETIGSGWGASFRNIFGNFAEAKKTFTEMSNTINDIINANALARNKVLAAWHDRGGRATLIAGIQDAFHALMSVISAVERGLHSVFPATTAQSLLDLTNGFYRLVQRMRPSIETIVAITRITRGLFSVLDIVRQVIMGVVHGLVSLAEGAGVGSGSLLIFVAKIADAIYHFDQFLKKSHVLTDFFGGLGTLLSVPLQLLGQVAGLIGSLFDGFSNGAADGVTGAVDQFGNALTPLQALIQTVMGWIGNLGNLFENIGTVIGQAMGGLGAAIAGAITPATFSQSLSVINTALLGGIALMIRNFFSGGIKIDASSGLFAKIKSSLDAVTTTLGNMQANLKADILLKIGAALALLTASIVVLSMIDGAKLRTSLIALGVGMAGMQAGLYALMTMMSKFGFFNIGVAAAAIVAMGASLLLLAFAVKVMASMELGDMARGLLGLWAALKIIQAGMSKMNVPGMFATASALLVLGVALNAIGLALKLFATMSLGDMAKGLIGVGGSLAVIGLAMRLMPQGMLLQSVALVALGIALNAIGAALKIFGSMSMEEIGKGLLTLAGALVIIGLAMDLMPATLPITAAGLILVGIALNAIGGAVKLMASMGWDEIAKGLVTLGGAMAILAIGLNAIGIVGTVGAVGLALTAAALAVLAPVLIAFGSMDWMDIVKSLTMLAGVFTILGLAGLVLAPLIPVILGLGVAMVLVGAGFALAGAGALLFASALSLLIASGTAGIGLLEQYLKDLLQTLPAVFNALGKSAVAFAQGIASQGPELVRAMSKIMGSMLDAVIKNVPKMGRAFMVMLNTGLHIISVMSPRIYNAGLQMILGFLRALNAHIGDIVTTASRLAINFMNAIGRQASPLANAAARMIIHFINATSDAIDNHSDELGRAGGRLAVAIVHGIIVGIGSGASAIGDAARNAAKGALDAAKDFLGINSPSRVFREVVGKSIPEGMAVGMDKYAHYATRSAEGLGRSALDTLKNSMSGVSDALDISADMNPTVTPVLDLSSLTRDANRMSSILATSPVKAEVSYAAAQGISNDTQATQQAIFEAASTPVTQEVKFEQTNVSPKALSPVEIYRNTRNQLSFAKEALKIQ